MDFIRYFIEYYIPPNYSEHGQLVDELIIYTHYLMFVLFFAFCLLADIVKPSLFLFCIATLI